MSLVSKPPLILLGCCITLLMACGNGPEEKAVSSLDADPLYAGISDSIRKDSTNAALYLIRGIRLSQHNAHEMAESDFRKSWGLEPRPETAIPYAANLSILGKTENRLNLLKTAIAAFPRDERLPLLLADAYANAGDKDAALMEYRKIIDRNPADPDAWYEQGLLLEETGDSAGAVAALKQAWSLQPVAMFGLELAHIYAEQRNPLALSICDRIIDQDSAGLLTDPFFIKGIYYANSHQYAPALAQFDSCIARDWKTTDAYLEKGRIRYQQQNYSEAVGIFTMATTVSNTDPDAYYWLARCYEAMKDNARAAAYYKKTLSLDRTFIQAGEGLKRVEPGFGDGSH